MCDKTIKIKSKSKHLKSLNHNELEKCIRIKPSIKKPDFFDKDELFDNYITNHIKKFNLYLVKCDFKSVSDVEFYAYNNSDLKK